MNKIIKKSLKLLSMIAVAAMIMVPVGASAHYEATDSYSYVFIIDDVSRGYTYSQGVNKIAGRPYYGVDVVSNLSKLPTNYMVIASNGVQIAPSMILGATATGKAFDYRAFYSANHAGEVFLRANSGSATVHYTVGGFWTPNGFDCGC